MTDWFYLAWQYLRWNKVTTIILVVAITLIIALPSVLYFVVEDAIRHFRSRADSVPLILGAKGSRLEIVLGTLYFDDPAPGVIPMSEVDRLRAMKLGETIPLHTGVRISETPLVATTSAYHRARGLKLQAGRVSEIPGECIVGSTAARRLGIDLGDRLPVIAKKAFTLRDRPLRLGVTGVLAPTETPDDDAIFVDLKTIWIIEGFGHGHVRGAKHGSSDATEYTDITKDNLDSFHFHGNESRFPVTAVLVYPSSAKSRALMLGEYASQTSTAQIVRPGNVMTGLLDKLLMVRSYVFAVIAILSSVTVSVILLVVALSIRMRRRELLTMKKMGGSRFAIVGILGIQILIILGFSTFAAIGVVGIVSSYGHQIIRRLLF